MVTFLVTGANEENVESTANYRKLWPAQPARQSIISRVLKSSHRAHHLQAMAGQIVKLGTRSRSTAGSSVPRKMPRSFSGRCLGAIAMAKLLGEPDATYMLSLLERHPDALQKFGTGIKRFFKKRTTEDTNCFWLERAHGSPTDFSYISCVNAKGKSLCQEFAKACRQAVQPQLTKRKMEHFKTNGDADGEVM